MIGGGIAGVSCAYHLAKAGVSDVVLVEKGELTSGSTHHAAGLVTQFNPSPTMMRFRRYSVQLYEELGVFEPVGSLRIASSRDSLLELRRGVSRAHAIGLDAELVGPEEARRLMPAITDRELYGAVWMPGDGYVDPHIATYAVASAARELGVEIRTHTLVTGIDVRDGRVRAVETESARSSARPSSTRPACGRRASPRWSARSPAPSRSTTSTSRCTPSRGTSCRKTCRASATPTTSSTARRRAEA